MKEISLALGGGGVRGAAHVGVLNHLENLGIIPKAIAGTSAGGIVGAFYAAGFSIEEIKKILNDMTRARLFGHSKNDQPSLLGLHGFSEIIKGLLGQLTFTDLRIPFACVAVDIRKNQEIVINKGSLVEAVLATIAVPGIFPPRLAGDRLLVDGGIFNPVPVSVARWLAPHLPVIAVCLSPAPEDFSALPGLHIPDQTPIPPSILNHLIRLPVGQALKVFMESIEATSSMLAELHLRSDKPDIILRPEVAEIGLLDRIDPEDLIRRGEAVVRSHQAEIAHIFDWTARVKYHFRNSDLPGHLLENGESKP